MQPTATMATAATTIATAALSTTWDNATSRPTAEPDPILDNYVLLVVVMSLFVGGTLVVLSGVLLLCRRCWAVHRRLDRAMEEAEKTTTTYLDNGAHPTPDPDFRGEDPEGQDAETERFLSTGSTGRRVSFNEAALFEQSRKTHDKGRRYTLTEGDFHHLKNARLTHLHLPPLKIVTIHECDSGEASAATTPHPMATPKASLAIFQPAGKALTGRSVGPSSALPGDPYNSAAGPADFEISPSASSDSGEGTSLDAAAQSAKAGGPGAAAGPGETSPGSGAGPVLQFFTRLRRHASLDGASPYFRVKKWKLEPSQRASSLDTRGSPKRHHFQRQRAASESTEQEDGDAPLGDFIQYIASAGDAVAFPPPRPFLASPTSPPPALGRLEAAEEAGAAGGVSPESPPERSGGSAGPEQQQPQESDGEREAGPEQAQTIYHDIWSLRASLELHAAAASDHSSSGNDRDSVRSGDRSVADRLPRAPEDHVQLPWTPDSGLWVVAGSIVRTAPRLGRIDRSCMRGACIPKTEQADCARCMRRTALPGPTEPRSACGLPAPGRMRRARMGRDRGALRIREELAGPRLGGWLEAAAANPPKPFTSPRRVLAAVRAPSEQ
ncbi:PREDICTED: protein Dos [Ceratotherium simum simum]|uniref:Protein Dos n=1 Tax=Ceratotherium simum simum TaxID=73337 RepID=A0ABM1DI32_CERSS|nr:PREDICTED: protein Dos [Ceratotherium simum simum]